MIAGMKSPWDEDTRKAGERQFFHDAEDQELLGKILERSISAPPTASESDVDFGGSRYDDDGESYLFQRARRRTPMTSRLFDTSGRDTAPALSSAGFIHDYENKDGRSTISGVFKSSAFDEPLFAVGDREREDNRQTFLFDGNEHLVRSQSAAPALRRSGSLGPPPGLGTSRLSYDSFPDEVTSNSSLPAGLRRPGSTVLIGEMQKESSSVLRSLGLESEGDGGGTVRPAPKTLMDLIQEDFPSSPSPRYIPEQGDAAYGNCTSEYDGRPHSASPAPPHYDRVDPTHHRHIEEHQGRVYYSHPDGHGGIPHSMDLVQAQMRDNYVQAQRHQHEPARMEYAHQRHEHERSGPHYAPQPQRVGQLVGREFVQDPLTQQRSVYAPVSHAPHAPVLHQQPAHYYETQPVYYTDRQPRSVAAPPLVQAQMLPPGHTVYVNTPAYGYDTLHYQQPPVSQHPRQHHVVHQGEHPSTQYISVVPVQAGSHMGVPSGNFGYWQHPAEVSPSQAPRPTVSYAVSQGIGPFPSSMPRAAPHSPVDPSVAGGRRQKAGQGRSPNEKGGKVRRGGGRGTGGDKHADGPKTSPLLDEFRASTSRDWTIYDIKGHVVEFCQDQNGSRFIQQRLEVGDVIEKQVVATEAIPDVERLRNDVFGNYVVQKLLEFGTLETRASLRNTLKGEMLALSLQMYGCRVVQKALETLDDEDIPRLLLEFHHNVLSCIQDQNGNHVIQKCIEVMSTKAKLSLDEGDEAKARYFTEQLDFVIDDVLNNVASLSCHPYGCRVLQRILEHCVEPKKVRTLDEISKSHRPLLDDQYGNYVIQHVLQYGRESDRDSVLHMVIENGLLKLSKQKFASNVIEKLLKYGNGAQRIATVREMLKVVDEHTENVVVGDARGSSVVLLMVRDAYANYVVQTALDVVPEGEEKRMLLEELNAHLAQLRNYAYAKNIVTKLGV